MLPGTGSNLHSVSIQTAVPCSTFHCYASVYFMSTTSLGPRSFDSIALTLEATWDQDMSRVDKMATASEVKFCHRCFFIVSLSKVNYAALMI